MFGAKDKPYRTADRNVEDHKRCPKCKNFRAVAEYFLSNRRAGWSAPDGTYRQSYCKSCHRARTLSTRKAKIAELGRIKCQVGCADCGYNTHAIALDFHHIRGPKLLNISSAVGYQYAWSSVLQEIKKCIVLCANCHRIRHATNKSQRT